MVLLLSGFFYSCSNTIESAYQIASWKNFTDAAITYTFDDNCAGQYTAINLFDQYDFQATFYPVIEWEPDWEKLKQAAQRGHEIGSHTVSHRNLSELNLQEQETELKNSQQIIDRIVGPLSALSFAYPFCIPSDESITSRYYIAARHCQGQIEKSTPDDFYNISSIICGTEGSINTRAHFIQKNEETLAAKGWCVYLLHGVDDDGGYSAISSSVLKESLAYLDENRDKYWVATFVDVVKYIRERDQASITEIKKTSKQIQLELSDGLDNEIYNEAISIERTLPAKWKDATVKQNNQALQSELVSMGKTNSIRFNAVPDAGIIYIERR